MSLSLAVSFSKCLSLSGPMSFYLEGRHMPSYWDLLIDPHFAGSFSSHKTEVKFLISLRTHLDSDPPLILNLHTLPFSWHLSRNAIIMFVSLLSVCGSHWKITMSRGGRSLLGSWFPRTQHRACSEEALNKLQWNEWMKKWTNSPFTTYALYFNNQSQ